MKPLVFTLALGFSPALADFSHAENATSYEITDPKPGIDHTHSAFTSVLKSHLRNNKVDYAGLKKSPQALNAYLDTLAAVPESGFNKWNKDDQMAFLINLYNAATLKLVIDHYPVKSIKDIGGFLRSPWKQKVVRVFGRIETLDHIEHDLLRPKYKDPRIHFAVNCASIGCPALRAEAFQGVKLDTQLNEQARGFLRDKSKNHLDAKNKKLQLSRIFDWFKDDFIARSGSVENFVTPFFNETDRKVIERGGLSIKYTEYDWMLNNQ